MKPFLSFESTAIPLPIENIDTDQIIPARFLKAIDQEGFGEQLFYDWRYLNTGTPNPDFVLNNPRYTGSILIAGRNFGCGSSREHAAWALAGYGFRVVVSSFFADIFKGNSLNNGLLPIQVSEEVLEQLLDKVYQNPDTQFHIDLEAQQLSIPNQLTIDFEIDPYKKSCLLSGQSDLDFLLSLDEEISHFEATIVF